jgi:UDP-N-acetylglucosamine 2-epimerase (non-hydrolysing)
MSKLRPLLVFGTRPEAIKMAPVVHECQQRTDVVEPIVCMTGQHREMLNQATQYFGIVEDEHLDLMAPNQTLATLTARCVEGIDAVIAQRHPHCVVAQGDTTTVMAASLAAFYRHVPFVHVEAGLRTGNLHAPWPEELNRRIVDITTTLYCAPTQRTVNVLLAEGVPPEAIRLTGNTVVDALLATLDRERENGECWRRKYARFEDSRVVLITGHRRESFGRGFEDICQAIAALADRFRNCHFVYPVHLNPNVQRPVYRLLNNRANVNLIPPVDYPEFVWLMDRSTLILTDSGGVQEEAPTLRKPVLVMRETTERPEAVEAGAARLVGTSVAGIVEGVGRLLDNSAEYAACQIDKNPYGDGHAAERIVDWMLERRWVE